MKFLTTKGELKEGTPVTDAEAKFIQDIDLGEMGGRYSVDTSKVREYILKNFILTIREPEPVQKDPENSGIEVIFPSAVAPLEYPEPSKSLPLVETTDDPMF